MSELKNICVDVETLSTDFNAVIVSISAVKFSLTTDQIETFVVNINPREGKELGLHISESTIDWWRKQKPEAVKAWMNSQIGLSEALDMFDEFCGKGDLTWFANGSCFDFPILDSSYKAVGKEPIFKYWKSFDLRTVYWLTSFDTKSAERVGTYHVGIDDCLTQIKWFKNCIGATK